MTVVRTGATGELSDRGTRRRITLAIVVLGVLLLVFATVRVVTAERAQQLPAEAEALIVDTVTVRRQPMPLLLESVGQVVPEHTVQVRPQISGMLKQVYFTEGQPVSVGQRLFLVEPVSFETALTSAKAAWESAKSNAQRLMPLATQGYVTPQDLINARAAADRADAAYKQAAINLGYTDVRAPISGRTGSIGVKAGNLVSPSDGTQLVTINQIRPIQVRFDIPQQLLPVVQQHQAQQNIKVMITRDDGTATIDEGTLIFIDNAVNTSTGTVTLKARVPNEQEQLWPGEYVGVHAQLAMELQAMVVPQTAVQTGQGGDYVYVVTGDQAETRAVRVDREVGALAVISSGLVGGEQVIQRVPRGLRSGMRITPAASDAPTAAEVTLPIGQ